MPTHPHSLQMTALRNYSLTSVLDILKCSLEGLNHLIPVLSQILLHVKMMEPENIESGRDFRGETKTLMLELTGPTRWPKLKPERKVLVSGLNNRSHLEILVQSSEATPFPPFCLRQHLRVLVPQDWHPSKRIMPFWMQAVRIWFR